MPHLPEYGTLAARDYANLGLIAGLEIHQQLLTSKKLFCHCPAGRYSRSYDAEILRHMRPTLSELGEYDGTALMEFKTRKEIIYRLNKESVCTYEMDDAPPFGLNEEALEIAMEIAMLLELQPVGEIHIARKQYLDGSIPTGFQRTTILGVQGSVPVGDRRVSIVQLGLEEDSCRELADEGHFRFFSTDRLSTPLIEIVTAPEMRSPGEVEEVAQALRRLVRATGKVRTGIGAARQDVNVSVAGGTRVEIKGVPRIPAIGRLVHNEALRQKGLLEIRDRLRQRGIASVGYEAPKAEVTELFQGCEYHHVTEALARGEVLGAVLLPGFADLLMRQIQPGVHFLREFRDRVKVVACLDRLPNLVCSDQLDDGPSLKEWTRARDLLDGGPGDPVILVWGPPRDVETALGEIELRAVEALAGVPGETRQAQLDGSTTFERVLPGPDRMYPDTDLPPLAISRERWAEVRQRLPVPPWELQAQLVETGLGAELCRQLLGHGKAQTYLALAPSVADKLRLAVLLTSRWRQLEREGHRMPPTAGLDWYPEFQAETPRDADLEALRDWAFSGGKLPPNVPRVLVGETLSRAVAALLADVAAPRVKTLADRRRYYAGHVRKRLGSGRLAPGTELMDCLTTLLRDRQEVES